MITVDRGMLYFDDKKQLLATPVPDLSSGMIIDVPRRHVAEFMELVHRATNLWPDASPDIKAFADDVIHGKQMQEYKRLYKPMGKSLRGNQ